MIPAEELFSWKSRSAGEYRGLRGRGGEGELLGLMAREPRLIRRPITVQGGRAIVGFDRAALGTLLGSWSLERGAASPSGLPGPSSVRQAPRPRGPS